jgi:hypothetical protein
MAVGLDTRRNILETHATQGTPGSVVAELLRLLDREAEIAANEFTPAKSKREWEREQAVSARTIAALLPSLLANVDVWAAAQLAVIDATPKRVSARTAGELTALDQRVRFAEDARTVEEAIADAEANATAYELRSLWSTAQRKLRELAAHEQRTYKLNGPAFQLLNRLELRLGKVLRRTLPDARRQDIAEETRRRKATVRQQVTDACKVLALDGAVAKAALELSAPTNATMHIGKFWDDLENKRRSNNA